MVSEASSPSMCTLPPCMCTFFSPGRVRNTVHRGVQEVDLADEYVRACEEAIVARSSRGAGIAPSGLLEPSLPPVSLACSTSSGVGSKVIGASGRAGAGVDYPDEVKVGACYNVFDGEELLEASIRSIRGVVQYVCVVYQTGMSWYVVGGCVFVGGGWRAANGWSCNYVDVHLTLAGSHKRLPVWHVACDGGQCPTLERRTLA